MDEALKSKILSWLAEEFDVASEPVPPNLPLEWALRVTTRGPTRISAVVQKAKGKDSIAVTLGVSVSEFHVSRMRELRREERLRLIHEIHRDVLLLCPSCIVALQVEDDVLRNVLVTKILYLDTLTRQALMDTVKTLINVVPLVSGAMIARLGRAGRPQERSGGHAGYM